jgi:hypothetical protein
MDIGSILLFIAILIFVALFISRPFLKHDAFITTDEEVEYSALLAERDRIINALQELEFDHVLGKIPENIYPSQRSSMLEKGALVLKKIDEYQGSSVSDDIDTRLEAAIESHRADGLALESETIDDEEIEEMIAQRLRARKGKMSGFCSQCGTPYQQSDRFCSKCGQLLN